MGVVWGVVGFSFQTFGRYLNNNNSNSIIYCYHVFLIISYGGVAWGMVGFSLQTFGRYFNNNNSNSIYFTIIYYSTLL